MRDSALLIMDVQNSTVERFADSAPAARGPGSGGCRGTDRPDSRRLRSGRVPGGSPRGQPEQSHLCRSGRLLDLRRERAGHADPPGGRTPAWGHRGRQETSQCLRRERSRHGSAGPTRADPFPGRDRDEWCRSLDTAAGRRPGLWARRTAATAVPTSTRRSTACCSTRSFPAKRTYLLSTNGSPAWGGSGCVF